MRHLSWVDASRMSWGNAPYEAGQNLPFDPDKVKLGTLQRIADAMELIAKRMDPAWQNLRVNEIAAEVKRNAASDARSANRRTWREAENNRDRAIKRKLRDVLRLHPNKKARTFINTLVWAVTGRMDRVRRDQWYDRKATEADAHAMMQEAETFNPITYDWSSIRLGPKARPAIEESIAVYKAAVAGPPSAVIING